MKLLSTSLVILGISLVSCKFIFQDMNDQRLDQEKRTGSVVVQGKGSPELPELAQKVFNLTPVFEAERVVYEGTDFKELAIYNIHNDSVAVSLTFDETIPSHKALKQKLVKDVYKPNLNYIDSKPVAVKKGGNIMQQTYLHNTQYRITNHFYVNRILNKILTEDGMENEKAVETYSSITKTALAEKILTGNRSLNKEIVVSHGKNKVVYRVLSSTLLDEKLNQKAYTYF